MFDNRNIFDFRAVHSMSGGPHLSMVWQHSWDGADQGSGLVLGNDYTIQRQLRYPPEFGAFDIHEFNILDDGNTSLSVTYRSHMLPMDTLGRPGEQTAVLAGGFAEMDVNTGEVRRDWDSVDQIPLGDTVHFDASSPASPPPGWDYVHANSIDKNSDGNYIMSMRFTNSVYMISGADGHIMWRLGGRGNSDFEQDFVFSKQHDAKFLESNGTHHIISILNNASDEIFNEEDVSSALIVELETGTTPMTAKVLRRYNRPDGHLTRLRGNSQVLPNDNIFIGWSERGYISEHADDGEVLLSANFASARFSTYRAYKFDFTGRPSYPPALVASVWGTDESDLTTTFYVSWNGATDIAWWNFYAQASSLSHPVFIGSVPKRDFETLFVAKGFLDWVSVEAVTADGNVLGKSRVHRTDLPKHWVMAGFTGDRDKLRPHDPAALYAADGSVHKAAGQEEADSNGGGGDSPAVVHPAGGVDSKELSRIVHETYSTVSSIGGLFLFVLVVCLACVVCYGAWVLLRRRRRKGSYQHVPREDDLPEEELRLHNVPPE
jgi:hypothetical protein